MSRPRLLSQDVSDPSKSKTGVWQSFETDPEQALFSVEISRTGELPSDIVPVVHLEDPRDPARRRSANRPIGKGGNAGINGGNHECHQQRDQTLY